MSLPPTPLRGTIVVTIDGPAGSGKSSTAREIARRLDFRHLDSGALYRTVALGLLRAGMEGALEREPDSELLSALDLALLPEEGGFRLLLDGADPGEAIRTEEVTRLAAWVAKFPAVRRRLLPLQRAAATFGGLVADGRDMGTIVFPQAPVKVFLTASLGERARRRLLQEGRSAGEGEIANEAGRIRDRDASDETRAVAPLRRAPGALLLDTTELGFEEQVNRIVEAVRRVQAAAATGGSGATPPGGAPRSGLTG
ncbi:MAG: (d)CMP kinase [Gemmatimonadota bacterium]